MNRFSLDQIHELHAHFEEHNYITAKEREDLAKRIGVSGKQVNVWFHNQKYDIKKKPGMQSSGTNSEGEDDVGTEEMPDIPPQPILQVEEVERYFSHGNVY